jgi:hypothetical protein
MKYVQVSYTLLDVLEVPEDFTPDDIEERVEIDMREKGIYNLVNDVEWCCA